MTFNAHTGQRIVLRRYPQGVLQVTDFALEKSNVPSVGEGELLIRNQFVSVDPMLRLFVDRNPLGGAFPPLPLGTTIPGAAVGTVVESRHSDFRSGDRVEGRFGWQDFALSNGTSVRKVNPRLGNFENALGIGGLPGFTAYVGLEIAALKSGQTVLVSGAAGAVGSVVGPIAARRGIRAVGIAAGKEKQRYLIEEAGYSAVADRSAPDFLDQLRVALPNGADVYFDNVGGPLFAAVLPLMARGGLALICGLMAQYQGDQQTATPDDLPTVLRMVMGKAIRIQSFTQYGQDALRPAFEEEIATLLAEGRIKPKFQIVDGLEHLPDALCGLFNKSIAGKVLVRVDSNQR